MTEGRKPRPCADLASRPLSPGGKYARSMVQSSAEDVDGYLAEVAEERRGVLTRLRQLCRSELNGFDEVMAYGMPAYERDGVAEIAFASQKQYISFYL